jgi:hypothetical protein
MPLVKQLLNKITNSSNHPDLTLRICDNLDWYAPGFQSHHSIDELRRWFTQEGFAEIRELTPAKNGWLFRWSYNYSLIIGSGVNSSGRKA